MKHSLILLIPFGLTLSSLASCSSNTSTPTPTTTMQWKAGTRATYAINARDTSTANFDKDLPSGYDTLIRTITAVNQFYLGKTNVAEYKDSSTRSRTSTIGRMYQDADGSVWIWDYAQPVWSTHFIGHTIADQGWVKYIGATIEGNWFNEFNIGYISAPKPTEITMEGRYKADESVTVQGKGYTATHLLFTISDYTEGGGSYFTMYIESFPVYELGLQTKEIVHSYNDYAKRGHFGTTTRMISYSN